MHIWGPLLGCFQDAQVRVSREVCTQHSVVILNLQVCRLIRARCVSTHSGLEAQLACTAASQQAYCHSVPAPGSRLICSWCGDQLAAASFKATQRTQPDPRPLAKWLPGSSDLVARTYAPYFLTLVDSPTCMPACMQSLGPSRTQASAILQMSS